MVKPDDVEAISPPHLPVLRLRMDFKEPHTRSVKKGHDRALPTSLWRRAFGTTLRKAVCVTGKATCRGCPVSAHCAYQTVFDPPGWPGETPPRMGTQPPKPFALHSVLVPAGTGLEIRLFGDAAQHADLVLRTLVSAAQAGLGGGKRVLDLRAVTCFDWSSAEWLPWDGRVPVLVMPGRLPSCTQVRIELCSPLRIIPKGGANKRPLNADELDHEIFFSTLARRVGSLAWAYAGFRGDISGWAVGRYAHELPMLKNDRLDFQDGGRGSKRQAQTIPMGGLLGSWLIPMHEALPDLWPWLWLGQWTQVGKGATQGLGVYRVLIG